MKQGYRFDFHIHTDASNDTLTKIERVVATAMKRGLSGIAVTDHHSMKGAFALQAYVKRKRLPLVVILGQEVMTNQGEIMGLFLKKQVPSEGIDIKDAIRLIREQNGVVVLPHPYRTAPSILEYVDEFDFIEVNNSRTSREKNQQALVLAEEHSKQQIVGSDAHWAHEIGKNVVVFKSPHSIREQLYKGAYKFELHKRARMEILASALATGYVLGGFPFLWKKFRRFLRGERGWVPMKRRV
jgi:predicted metal-dependent phosphoesterase TrpH